MGRRRTARATVLLLLVVGAGCDSATSADTAEDTDVPCNDQLCHSFCAKEAWAGLESYWALSASCQDYYYCACSSRCDEALCNDHYCREERGFEGGTCGIGLSCTCYGDPPSPSDGGDAADGGDSG